ncbi:MAG: SagB/ThcOx family dehydrogenase [Kiritimatiellae bacterium]|nr:SagB/ThcOx family dehydrogenase [Kiritimatiellia bacterium]
MRCGIIGILIAVLMANANGFAEETNIIKLPAPTYQGKVALQTAIKSGLSVRAYANKPLTLEQLSQVAWSAQGQGQGKNMAGIRRTAPSAGATYPLEVYLVIGEKTCGDLPGGVYHYLIGKEHPEAEQQALALVKAGDQRKALAAACRGPSAPEGRPAMGTAPLIMVITGCFPRAGNRYRELCATFTYFEAGHVGQNVDVQATALGLGTSMVGCFDESKVTEALVLPLAHEPLYVIPIGFPLNK